MGRWFIKRLNQEGEKMPTGFLIKKIAEDEKENLEKFLYGMRDFLHQYSLPESTAVAKFISGASLEHGRRQQGDFIYPYGCDCSG